MATKWNWKKPTVVKLVTGGIIMLAILIWFTHPPQQVEATEWAWCANEGQRCLFSGTSEVWYGAGSRGVTGTFTNGADCNSSQFGDPAPGQPKACFQRPVGGSSGSGSSGGSSSGSSSGSGSNTGSGSGEWTWCANEWQRCLFSGTAEVWYGASSGGVIGVFTNGADCNSSQFGDPAPGQPKACFQRPVGGSSGSGSSGGSSSGSSSGSGDSGGSSGNCLSSMPLMPYVDDRIQRADVPIEEVFNHRFFLVTSSIWNGSNYIIIDLHTGEAFGPDQMRNWSNWPDGRTPFGVSTEYVLYHLDFWTHPWILAYGCP